MEQKITPENERDFAKSIELPENSTEKGIEMLENPPNGDFVAALKAFVSWVQSVFGKKD